MVGGRGDSSADGLRPYSLHPPVRAYVERETWGQEGAREAGARRVSETRAETESRVVGGAREGAGRVGDTT